MTVGEIPKGKFLGACLEKSHMPLEIIELDFPKSLAEKQVLVRNIFSSICGSQIGEIDAKKGPDKFLPHLLGHEAVSEVVAIGSEVSEVKIGDRVILHWMKGKGGEALDHSLVSGKRKINAGPITTCSEYSLVSENRCTRIQTTLKLENLPLFGCSITTAYGSLINDAKVNSNDALVVLGLGALGMWTLEMSRIFKVSSLIGIDTLENRVSRAQKLGFASEKWNFSGDEPEIIRLFKGRNASKRLVLMDTTGSVDVINKAFEWIKGEGVMVLVGVTPHPQKITIDPMPLHFGAKIVGSFGGSILPQSDIPYLLRMAEEEQFQMEIMEKSFFDLSEINQAIELLRSGSTNKMILKF
jgi:Zn-dependent alcohol dehydrogenase